MQYEEFRRLKQQILTLCMQPPSPAVTRRPGGRTRARRASPLAIGRPIALGARLTQTANDVLLSVYLQDRALLENREFLGALEELARGQLVVRYIGEVQLSNRSTGWLCHRIDPLRVGFSVSGPARIAGTIGFFANDGQGRRVLVSNRHVLCPGSSDVGAEIWHPGWLDGGRSSNAIARVTQAIPVTCAPPHPIPAQFNHIDAACGVLDDGILGHNANIPYIGALRGVTRPAYEAMKVRKVGRTTLCTKGVLLDFSHGPFSITWNGQHAWFDEQLVIEGDGGAFSTKGDSGALVVDNDNVGIGMIFADSGHGLNDPQHLTFANPLIDVISALGLDKDSIWT